MSVTKTPENRPAPVLPPEPAPVAAPANVVKPAATAPAKLPAPVIPDRFANATRPGFPQTIASSAVQQELMARVQALRGQNVIPTTAAAATDGKTFSISSEFDDPFASETPRTDALPAAAFSLGTDGKPTGLTGPVARIEETKVLSTINQNTGDLIPLANNPWTAAKPDADGNFLVNEQRFPLLDIKRGADGRPVLDAKGLQTWGKQDSHLGQTTAFTAINQVHGTAESFSGRPIAWGQNGQISLNPHEFVDLNAFFNPADGGLHFGVVPYQTPGSKDVKIFEMASSWEVVAHEAGHAIHDVLKPNHAPTDLGFGQWGESFGDQNAMWSSLQDPARVAQILKETGGDMSKPSALTRTGELFGPLTNSTGPLRDALNTKKVSDTSTEVHDRSEVLNGFSYKLFQNVYADQLKSGLAPADALRESGKVMGTFLMRATDHTPENTMSLEDVGKAYLKVDKEYFGGKFHDAMVKELTTRQVFTARSDASWKAHEAGIPALSLTPTTPGAKPTQADATKLLQANLTKLGMPAGFGLKVQDFTVDDQGQALVRVTMTRNNRDTANNGILVFRKDGTLSDFQSPRPAGATGAQLTQLFDQAEKAGLDQHGPVAVVRKDDGSLTARTLVPAGTVQNPHLTEFTLDNPAGERRDYFFRERELNPTALKALLPEGAELVN